MKFTVATRPLKNAISLGIIKANVSKFYRRSALVQITANRDTLQLNVEAASIKTSMILKGSGDSDTPATVLVDCLKFKSLVESIDSDVMSIDFIQGGIYINAGTSKFAVAQTMDADDMRLDEPADVYAGESSIKIKSSDWQFIKDHQMYALATSKERPVYTYVWVSEDKEVIVGDSTKELFTYSKKGNFDTTCLFPPTLVNLFISIPENSIVSKYGKSYILRVNTEDFSLITEFTPKYEDDEAVGQYNANMVLEMLQHPDAYITVDVVPILKFISQSAILKYSTDTLITLTVNDTSLVLQNSVGTYSMAVPSTNTYSLQFDSDSFKNILANMDSDKVNIAPTVRDGKITGCIFWTEDLTAVFASKN